MTEYIFVIKKTTHGQFHLIDDEAYPDPSDVWTDEACANRLAVTQDFVGIGVLQDQPEVVVTLVIEKTCVQEELDACDHIVECSLQVQSGRLLIAPWAGFQPAAAPVCQGEVCCWEMELLCYGSIPLAATWNSTTAELHVWQAQGGTNWALLAVCALGAALFSGMLLYRMKRRHISPTWRP